MELPTLPASVVTPSAAYGTLQTAIITPAADVQRNERSAEQVPRLQEFPHIFPPDCDSFFWSHRIII
eukprot:10305451-Karenia_brevis.AAC.1